MPRLHVTLSDGTEVTHELTEETITVGRVEDNALQIEEPSVSSHHAELSRRGEDYVLKDIGSTNGTTLNGQAAEADTELPLSPGDRIVFGHIAVRYLSDSAGGGDELPPLPAESEVALAPASSSAVPSNFTNASPFQSKKEKKDPGNAAVLALGVLAIGAAGFAIYTALQIQPPQ